MVKIIVVFDVLEEYREVRDELRRYLKDRGGFFRQYSVYEVDLPEREVSSFLGGIRRIIRKGAGRVEVLFPCSRCYSGIVEFDTYDLFSESVL